MILSFLLVAAQVVLVGDSTLQVRPDEAPQGSWGMMAAERLKPGVGVCNLAVGGRSTRTYRDVWETNVLKTVKAGDWVVIQFGHNDGWKDSDPKAPRRETDPQTEYKDNLRRFVSEIRALDAKPVLVTSISLYLWKKDGTWPVKDPLEPWVQAMREVAAETRTLLVDLHAPTLREVRALGRETSMMWFMYSVNGRDWAHPTKYGARMIARIFWEELRRTGGPFAECFDLSDLGATWAERLDAAFALDGRANIIAPDDCGLVNGRITLNGRLDNPLEVRGIFAPPYSAANASVLLRIGTDDLVPAGHVWRPECLTRIGTNGLFCATSRLVPVAGERAAILNVEIANVTDKPQKFSVSTLVAGGVDIKAKWQFGKPTLPPPCDVRQDAGLTELKNPSEDAAVVVSVVGDVSEGNLAAGESRNLCLILAIGSEKDARAAVASVRKDPAAAEVRSLAAWRSRVAKLASRFPELQTDNAQFFRVYCRSLLHFLLNEWDVPEFRLRPYYATGGMNGGCIGNYLWNFGEVYRMWPLLDPAAAKAQIRKFLSLDLGDCYAYDPYADEAFGPYYPVNQEKILLLAHAYVLETGDRAFLNEDLDGKTIIARLVGQALLHDDLAKDAVLVDYGYGNHHLELREKLRYDGVLPDLNLRRVVNFRLADELCRLAGYDPKVDLVSRAEALRKLVRRELWDAEKGWFANIDHGRRETRWTMQMFKALGWGDWVLDADLTAALVKHLMDPREFLGPYGVHSLSKLDPAYDENDVDNGGPGACVSFAPALVDRLYRDGRTAEAAEIFTRLWWLADALPYWGDSHYADRKDYRRDTPLMNDIQGGALAQTVLFGVFGLEPHADGTVASNPRLPPGVRYMALRGVKMCGRTFDVEAGEKR